MRREGLDPIAHELKQHIQRAEGERRALLSGFYEYVKNNRDVLVDMEYRACPFPPCLAAPKATRISSRSTQEGPRLLLAFTRF